MEIGNGPLASDKRTVLLVEDEALIAIAQKKILERYGYAVVTAHSGNGAIEKVRTTPGIDLILMDINLGKGKMDGTEAAEIILKGHDIPVLFLSSYTQPEIVERTEKITSYGYVVKDSGETVLNASIKMAFKLNKAHRELKETKGVAERYLNVAAEIILSLDTRGNIALLNDSGHKLLGYDKGELIGKSWFDTCLPERLREEVKQVFAVLVQGRGEDKDVLTYENPVITESGEELTILWHNTVLRNDKGETITLLSSGEDITERKRAEEALRRSEKTMRAFFDAVHETVVLIDREGTVVLANAVVAERLGKTVSELVGTCLYDQFPPDVARRRKERYDRVIATGLPVYFEDTRDMRSFEHHCQPVLTADGTVAGVTIFAYETTSRRKTETALRQSEEKYRSLFENAVEGIFQTTPKGGYISANHALARFFGYDSPRELMEATTNIGSQRYADPRDRQAFMDAFEGKGVTKDFEVQLLRRDGTPVWASMNARAVRDEKGAIIYYEGTVEDITSRKEAEEALKLSESRLSDIIEFLPDATFVIDQTGTVVAWNRAMVEMTGVRKEDMIGRGEHAYTIPFYGYCREQLLDLIDTSNAELESKYQNVKRMGKTLYAEVFAPSLHGGKGAYIWVTGTPLFNDRGARVGAIESIRDITDRKEVEEALKKSKELLDATGRMAKVGGWEVEAETRKLAWTEEIGRILELSQGDIPSVEETILFFHPEFRDTLREALRRAFDRGVPYDLEIPLITAKGNRVWTRSICTPEAVAGKVVKLVGTFQDVTDRKNAEEALRASETRYRHLFEVTYDYVHGYKRTAGSPYTIDWLGGAYERITGYSREEIMQMSHWLPFVHPEDVANTERALLDMRPGDSSLTEFRIVRKDGDIRWILHHGLCVRDEENPEFCCLYGACQDITEPKRAEIGLRESEKKYRILVDNNQSIIYTIGAEGIITFVSPSWKTMLGYEYEEVVGRSYKCFIHEDDVPTCEKFLRETVETGAVQPPVEYRVFHKDRTTRIHRSIIVPAFDEQNNLVSFVGNAIDLTDFKRAEMALKSSLREKELLLKEVHHRVKNNLMVVSSILNLQSGTIKDRKAKDLIEDCRKRIQAMSLVHNRLYRSTDLARISFKEYAGDLLMDISRSYGDRPGNVILVTDVGDVAFDIDTAIPLGLIMNELVSNAMKHAFPGERKGTVTVSLHEQEGGFLLAVKDDGIGFPEGLDFTFTESLGMQLVVTLAEQIDGSIGLTRGNGTEFRVMFRAGHRA